MKTNFSTISPFGIDESAHAPPLFMIFIFLSPFDINGKG
jgi:hypothetical protein